MEVHAHTHTARKKWTHYFWEFFMLFLAVLLGFFVENQREHYIEHKREVEYIRSMIEDLKEDTASFNKVIQNNLVANEKIDTLIRLLKGKERNSFAKKIYYMARTIPLLDEDLLLQNKTFEQLKGSGGLRLIRNMQTQNKIGAYYHNNKFIETGFSPMQFQNRRDLFMAFDELFDAAIMQEIMRSPRQMPTSIPDNQFKLLSDDPKAINRFCTRYHAIYSTKRVTSIQAKYLINKAAELIKYLKKEFHLK
ncbi:MAG TPA: hypothetical protein VIU35_12105 [Chitinophagaceae bacterium]